VKRRLVIVLCLGFSGVSALVYEIIWTRLLGFAFGTTTEAISTVLAVFFGGMALGNLLAAKRLERVTHPLRVYARLELAIGAFALVSLPLLRRLPLLYAWIGAPDSELALTAVRLAVAAAVLLPPTIAMGATLPVVARGLVTEDGARGRWSALLYGANTCGAVVGAYLSGFWLIPLLGLTRSVLSAGAVNLLVAGAVLTVAHRMTARPSPAPPAAAGDDDGAGRRRAFLAFFGVSGFVAIGYEIIWSKLFGIVMEGTLYGFAAVLSAYLLGIGLGSLVVAHRVDRIRDLPRAFALLHVAVAASVVAGSAATPLLPYVYHRVVEGASGGDAIHWLYLLVLPILLVPTGLLGAAFPILIRIFAPDAASVGRGMGLASAVNTAGSIAASLVVGFWWIPALGMDASLYLLVMLELCIAIVVLWGFQRARGLPRAGALVGAACLGALLSLSYGGVRVEQTIAGRQTPAPDLSSYRGALARAARSEVLSIQGRSSIVTVYALPHNRLLRTNGMPEAGFSFDPPFYPLETVSLGLVPYLLAPARPERALVIGFGGGNTVNALLRSEIAAIEVVELEEGVIEAAKVMHAGRANPLDDPRVRLRIGDGRNDLFLRTLHGDAGYDLIASQPSHPWRIGAANLFTEDFFRIAHAGLAEDGIFALWVNGFRTDPEALIAIAASFERVFPGALLLDIGRDPRNAFLLLGERHPIRVDVGEVARRLAQPGVRELLAEYGIHTPEDLLARSEGPASVLAWLSPEAANTDDNAFVETRTPRHLDWNIIDYAEIERRLPDHAPVLPPSVGPLDLEAVALALLRTHEGPSWAYGRKVARFLNRHAASLPTVFAATVHATALTRDPESEAQGLAELRALAAAHPEAVEPLRRLGNHLASVRRDWRGAADAFARAHERSGASRDAYDAGRALYHLDPEAAWPYFAGIPDAERSDYPRLAFYAAERALRGPGPLPTPGALRAHYAAVRAYAASRDGHAFPGVHELLARLAAALGDRAAARAHADADAAERARRAAPAVQRARAALARHELPSARAAVQQASALRPGDGRLAELRARLALASNDREGLEAALADLRTWAPSLEAGLGAENRFRSEHDLPLLPERPAAVLAERPETSRTSR
jgi:spermidine synthase